MPRIHSLWHAGPKDAKQTVNDHCASPRKAKAPDILHSISPRLRAQFARTAECESLTAQSRRRCLFRALKRLELRPETELCLGLVHYTDGVGGTKKRLATAKKYAGNFSIATECGFGRRDPRTIPELLRIHVEVADSD